MRTHKLGIAAIACVAAGCTRGAPPPPDTRRPATESAVSEVRPTAAIVGTDAAAVDPPEARRLRARLIDHLVAEGDLATDRVRDVMLDVPRHLFVPDAPLHAAYFDEPLPIGLGQTISQPAVVAMMTEALDLRGGERVLEIGTGSGYQAAILSRLAAEVYTIEIVPELAEMARQRLAELGYANVHVRSGDGYAGWPERAPFDRVVVTAAPPELPKALVAQLADGGVLVAPVGPTSASQRLMRYRKHGGLLSPEDLGAVRFVPMVTR